MSVKTQIDGRRITVLVTGGAGYVGTHTIVQFLNDDIDVIVVDNTPQSDGRKPVNMQRVEELTGKSLQFYNESLNDVAALQNIFKRHRIDCVIHLAALKAVGDSVKKPLEYYENNVSGTLVLLNVMKEYGVKNIVFSSSATVYGLPSCLPMDESHPTGQSCTNPYGRTKYFIEEILRDLCHSDSQWKATCLRYFNPVGAHPSGRLGEDPNGVPNNLMPFVAQVAVGRRSKLLVFGSDYDTPDGTGVRDYIHIMDLADGHVVATRHVLDGQRNVNGWKAFNLGLGRGYSVLEVVSCFESVSGRKIPVELVERRPGDVAACYSDCSLAAKELSWNAKLTLKDMCADMWRWQSMNPDGYKSA